MNSLLTFRAGLALLVLGGLGQVRAEQDADAKPAADQSLTAAEQLLASANAHFLAARSLEQDGQMRAALDHYIAFLKSGADDPDLVFHIARMSLDYRGMDETLALLEDAAKAHPQTPVPALNLALFAMTNAADKEGLIDRAVEITQRALARFPQDASVYESATRVRLLKEEPDKAAEILQRALQQNIAAPGFWLKLGRTAQEVWPLANSEKRQEHLTNINPFYTKALAKAQAANNAEAQLEIADFYLFSNQIDRSTAICEVLSRRDNNLDAQKRLVRLYDALDRQGDSLTALENLVKTHPTDVEHRRLLAREYIKKNDAARAVEQLEGALKAGGGDLNDYLQISNLLQFVDQPEKLDRFTIRALRLYPGEPRVGFYRAQALIKLKKYGEAASLFSQTAQQAETMAPELLDDRFHFSWGVALERSGNFDDAAQRFDKSIQLTPTDGDLSQAANTMNYLGYMWLERGQHLDKAEQLIKKANELEQDNPSFIDSLGWLYLKQGKPAEALKELLKAESLMEKVSPEDAEIFDHIAQTYDRLGQPDKAREYWQRAYDLMPETMAIRERAAKALGIEKPAVPKAEKE